MFRSTRRCWYTSFPSRRIPIEGGRRRLPGKVDRLISRFARSWPRKGTVMSWSRQVGVLNGHWRYSGRIVACCTPQMEFTYHHRVRVCYSLLNSAAVFVSRCLRASIIRAFGRNHISGYSVLLVFDSAEGGSSARHQPSLRVGTIHCAQTVVPSNNVCNLRGKRLSCDAVHHIRTSVAQRVVTEDETDMKLSRRAPSPGSESSASGARRGAAATCFVAI